MVVQLFCIYFAPYSLYFKIWPMRFAFHNPASAELLKCGCSAKEAILVLEANIPSGLCSLKKIAGVWA